WTCGGAPSRAPAILRRVRLTTWAITAGGSRSGTGSGCRIYAEGRRLTMATVRDSSPSRTPSTVRTWPPAAEAGVRGCTSPTALRPWASSQGGIDDALSERDPRVHLGAAEGLASVRGSGAGDRTSPRAVQPDRVQLW